MNKLVVLDNTILSNFARVQQTDAVFALWGKQLCAPREVLAEYAVGVSLAQLPAEDWSWLPAAECTPEEIAFGQTQPARLGNGERAALSIAYHRKALLATDDLFARQIAGRYAIVVIGTVGILLRCLRRGILTQPQAQTALDQMIAAGYRSPITDIGEI